MTYLQLKNYLEESIGVNLDIMFRRFEGPFLPEAVYWGIQRDRLNEIRGYLQPRRYCSLNEIEVVYFMNTSKVNVLRALTENYIGLDGEWKHPEIVSCDISTTFKRCYKPTDVAYQLINIKFNGEAHSKNVVNEELKRILHVPVIQEDKFDYQNELEEKVGNNFLIVVRNNEGSEKISLQFITKKSANIIDIVGYVENIGQYIIRRDQKIPAKKMDFIEFQALNYTYEII